MTIPNKEDIEIVVGKFFDLLFPYNEDLTDPEIKLPSDHFRKQLEIIFKGLTPDNRILTQFLDALPSIKITLLKDAEFIFASDPAAKELTEVIAIYPGFFAIFCYRVAHTLNQFSIPFLPRMITEYAHKTTGIDIHPGATIGSPVSIDHGTGIVIGETTYIGNYVKLYQGVTLGALSVDKKRVTKKRHPTIEDNVILYAGSTILGGETIVGRNTIVGGNVWLIESVAPFSVVYHKSEIVVRDQNRFHDVMDFNI